MKKSSLLSEMLMCLLIIHERNLCQDKKKVPPPGMSNRPGQVLRIKGRKKPNLPKRNILLKSMTNGEGEGLKKWTSISVEQGLFIMISNSYLGVTM